MSGPGRPAGPRADRKHFGAALLFATGSAAHLERLQALASSTGIRLDPDGLYKGRSVSAAEERNIYPAMGQPFIEPELREGQGEIERALKGELPNLATDCDLKGILHCHTDASDGTETLEKMAKATRSRGYAYFGVADHSKSAHYDGGCPRNRSTRSRRRRTASTSALERTSGP